MTGDDRDPSATTARADAFAASLTTALDRIAATQEQVHEALDVLAVAAGMKRLTVLVHAAAAGPWHDAVGPILAAAPVATRTGPAWTVAGELANAPDWYAEGVRAHRHAQRLIFVSQAEASMGPADALCAEADILPIMEAESLGYPECCVDAQHQRMRSFHSLMARLIERAAGPDRARMLRLARAAVVLPPSDAAERQALAAALDTTPAPFTAVNMCRACAADRDSPAWRLSRAYEELARRAGLHRLLAAAGAH